jgi:hypothetical protein
LSLVFHPLSSCVSFCDQAFVRAMGDIDLLRQSACQERE